MSDPNRPTPSAVLTTALVAVVAVAAVWRGLGADTPGRVALFVAAAILVIVAGATLGRQPWALGVAFLLGICWFWATLAQGLQQRMGAGAVVFWLLWSIGVMVTSVRARPRG